MKQTLIPIVLAGLCMSSTAVTGCGSSSSEDPKTPPATEAEGGAPVALSSIVAFDDFSVNQAVKVTLLSEGQLVEKTSAPVIANRAASIRVFVKASGTAPARPVIDGELTLKRPGKPDLVLRHAGQKTASVLNYGSLSTTLNFDVAAEEIVPETSASVKITSKSDGVTGEMMFPADGSSLPLRAQTASQTLKVKFVKIAMDDAGSAISPDVDLDFYRDALFRMYPVANVEVSVREQPFTWGQEVQPDGDGWDDLLRGIVQLRRADDSPQNVYYVGVFTPKPSLSEFCDKGSCVLGIAPQTTERDVNLRVALVLGYKSRGAGGTLAQELAHAMGRMHAPCGNPADIDDAYPYERGGIGSWGFDIVDKVWVDPQRSRDFMSYCSPVWVSDYTFQGLYDRMELVGKQMAELGAAPPAKAMKTFHMSKDGSIQAGPEVDVVPGEETGPSVPVTYEDDRGQLVTTKGYVRTIVGGTGGRIIVAPQAPASATKARVNGVRISDLRATSRWHH